MTIVMDITCPSCERAEAVRKVGIGVYRCDECELEFTHDDVVPE